MSTTNNNTTPLEVISVQQFMMNNNFVSVNRMVNTNVHGYPFVTFIDADNKAENVYFSVNTSAKYTKGQVIEPGFFKGLGIAKTINADGEMRTKLVNADGGNRILISDLF